MRKPALEFNTTFDTGEVIGRDIGRMYLGDGDEVIRFIMAPDGLHLFVDEDCKFIHTVKEMNRFTGTLKR